MDENVKSFFCYTLNRPKNRPPTTVDKKKYQNVLLNWRLGAFLLKMHQQIFRGIY